MNSPDLERPASFAAVIVLRVAERLDSHGLGDATKRGLPPS